MTLSPQLADDLNSRALTLGSTCLSNLSQFYANGFWHSYNETAWWLELGPACLAATMSRYSSTQNATYRATAIATVERAIQYNLRPVTTAGGITYTMFAAGYEGLLDPSLDDTCTIECIASIGWIMQMLPDLDSTTATRWLTALKLCCNWLDGVNGNSTYYINGNFAVHLCLAYYHVADLCRKAGSEADYQTYIAMYERAYLMMITPGTVKPTQFVGYGRIIEVTGVQPDWSDYTGYLTETNGYLGNNYAGNRWDPYYSTLQLDLLGELYLLKRDVRIMQLINLIHNKMASLINTTAWTIDASGGSRQTGTRGWINSWLYVMTLIGQRNVTRTMLTDVNCKASWDNQLIGSMVAGTTTNQIAPSTQRQYAIAIALTSQLSNAANKVIT